MKYNNLKHVAFTLIFTTALIGSSCAPAWKARPEISNAEEFYAAMSARRKLVKNIYAPNSGLNFEGELDGRALSTSMPKVNIILGSDAMLRLDIHFSDMELATFTQNGLEFVAADLKNKKGVYGNFGKFLREKYPELNLDTKDVTAWQFWLPVFQKREGETVFFSKMGDVYEVEYVNSAGEFDRAISVDVYSLYPTEMRFLKDSKVVVAIEWSKPIWLKDRDLVIPSSFELSAPAKNLEFGFTLKKPQFDRMINEKKTFDVKKRARSLRRKNDMKDINAPDAAKGQKRDALKDK